MASLNGASNRMKFSIAVHMERKSEDESIAEKSEQVLEVAKFADEAGFEIVWATEHHGQEYIIGPNPFLLLIHLGDHTKQIRLGTAVLVAPYWHPLRAAGEAAMTDILTGGRLELGIARGAFQYEFDRMAGGIPQEAGGEHLREMLPAIKALWAGDYAHDGKIWQFPTSTSVPKPLQQPGPPLWAAARSPETFDWSVKHGMNIMATPHRLPISEVLSLADKLQTAVANNPGHDRPRFLVSRMACVYDDPADWQIPVEAMREGVRVFMGLFNNTGDVVNGFPTPISIEQQDARGDYRPEAMRTNMMFGTPDEVVAKLRQYEALGVDVFSYNTHFGLPHDRVMSSLKLFADEVMPQFQGGQRATIEDAFPEAELDQLKQADAAALDRVQSGLLV